MDELLIKQVSEIVLKCINEQSNCSNTPQNNGIPIGISGRHVHLSRQHVDILFGKGYELKVKKILMGGQYACEECITAVGAKLRAIENVRILGPERSFSQVEISKTDAIKLGICVPFRQSGDIEGTAPISIVGPNGAVYLEKGCIIAKRHIHMSPEDAARFSVSDKDIVRVHFDGERAGTLDDVLIRVDKSFTLEMHLDTDEANGLGLTPKSLAYICK